MFNRGIEHQEETELLRHFSFINLRFFIFVDCDNSPFISNFIKAIDHQV